MKRSFELEDSFRSLNHIPRSQTQKKKTFNLIIQQGKPSPSYRTIFSNWAGLILTLSMLIVCTGFLYIQIATPLNSQHSSIKTADHFAAGEVERTYLGRASSDYYFSLKTSNLTMPGILSMDDKQWLKTINKALVNMEQTDVKPAGNAAYDLLVISDGREPAQLKLWFIDDNIFIKQFNSEEIYKLPALQAQEIKDTLIGIQQQVQF